MAGGALVPAAVACSIGLAQTGAKTGWRLPSVNFARPLQDAFFRQFDFMLPRGRLILEPTAKTRRAAHRCGFSGPVFTVAALANLVWPGSFSVAAQGRSVDWICS